MKKSLSLFIFLICLLPATPQKFRYPFENPKLDAEKRIENLVSLMNLEEKINLFGGSGIPRLGVKGAGSLEAIHGLVLGGPAWDEKHRGPKQVTTVFPQGYGLGETWDTELIHQVAEYMSIEARYLFQNPKYRKGGLILWAPNADLGRDIRWGRTEECYGEDPYLTGEMTTAMVKGMQGDNPSYWRAASLMKHFLANSNEYGRAETSSDFDDALFREYYSYPFMRGITKGGANALMTAYNAYNGTPCTYHPMLQNILMKEWKFNGMIMTDGGAFQQLKTTHKKFDKLEDAAKACIAGGTTRFLDDYKTALTDALNQGLVTEKNLESNIKGNLRILLKLGMLDASANNPYSKIGVTDTIEPWTKPETKELVRQVARKSAVLLKNNHNILPLNLKKIKKIAIVGNKADAVIEDWYSGTPAYKISALQGIKNAIEGSGIEWKYAPVDKKDEAYKAALWADVVVVCVGNEPTCSPDWTAAPWGKSVISGEGREDVDRTAITLDQEDLIKVVYKANPNTIVALISSFPYAINWTKEHVPGIIHMTQSCQELGNALADVIFGKYNPGGKTTQTWPAGIEDLPPMLDYDIRNGRTYMYNQSKPLFPFGYGLSYTNFEYSNMKVQNNLQKSANSLTITADIKNNGDLDGDEVAQVYIKFEHDKAKKRLKGFKRLTIKKGETRTVTFAIKSEDLKLWDNASAKWVLPSGSAEIQIGSSSETILLNKSVLLN